MNLADLPPTIPVWDDDPEKPSARWLFPDLGRGTLYEGVRRKDIPSIRVSGRILLPTARLLELVGTSSFDGVHHNGEEATQAAAESKARLEPGFTTT